VKLYLVEDDLSFSVELEMKIKQIGHEVVGKSTTYNQASLEIPSKKPDIIITDIKLDNGHTGLELAKSISRLNIPMIFVTAYSDESSYNKIKSVCSSFKYIVKPFDKLSLKSIIDDLIVQKQILFGDNYLSGEYLFIKKNNIFERIKLANIKYLYSEGNYTTLVLADKKFMIKYSLSKLLKLDKFSQFLRIHRNYAVNKASINSVDFSQRKIDIISDSLPFGRTYTKDIRMIMNIPFSGKS